MSHDPDRGIQPPAERVDFSDPAVHDRIRRHALADGRRAFLRVLVRLAFKWVILVAASMVTLIYLFTHAAK